MGLHAFSELLSSLMSHPPLPLSSVVHCARRFVLSGVEHERREWSGLFPVSAHVWHFRPLILFSDLLYNSCLLSAAGLAKLHPHLRCVFWLCVTSAVYSQSDPVLIFSVTQCAAASGGTRDVSVNCSDFGSI